MADDNYDEFGNYIGEGPPPDEEASMSEDDDDDDESQDKEDEEENANVPLALMGPEAAQSRAVVLHEHKKYYPEAEELYGDDVDIRVEDEDTQALDKPIIEPVRVKNFDLPKRRRTSKTEDRQKEFLCGLMDTPAYIRNVCIAGHLHHGKTTFMDFLQGSDNKYADTRIDEQQRGLGIKSTPVSMVLQSSKHKSYLFNVIDTPGHVNFVDEVAAAARICDGVCLVVDALEGVMINTEKIIQHCMSEQLPMVLLINKIDRLILELKLPPEDAYVKLKHTIEEVNSIIGAYPHGSQVPQKLSPELGNVAFASSQHAWCFTLQSFAEMYSESWPPGEVDSTAFVRRLWGDIYYDKENRTFSRKKIGENPRGFVYFVLEPLYKIYSQTVGEEPKSLNPFLQEIGVSIRRDDYLKDVNPFMTSVISRFFEGPTAWSDLIINNIPSPSAVAEKLIPTLYTGPLSDDVVNDMMECNPDGKLMIYVTKLFHKADASGFNVLGRVLSGTLKNNRSRVKILGEAYSLDDEEDMAIMEVTNLYVPSPRELSAIPEAKAGNWVLIDGIHQPILKTATITTPDEEGISILKPLKHLTLSVMKVAVEPLQPQELPRMVDGIRSINKTYPLCITKVEESGEHILVGTGEVYMDSVLHDLRRMYADIEVKVSDPVTAFCETVVETSSIKCFAETPNKKNKLTMISEPLEKGLAESIENKTISLDMPKKQIENFFQTQYDWDLLAARSVWAFGPNNDGANVLLDDTLASEVDKTLFSSVKDSIIQGFQWGTREGPLCDEPIRNVKFRILDAAIASEPFQRGSGQIIPTSRRVAYSAFLMATPRLMEPVYFTEIQTPVDCISAIYTVLARRRGHVTQDLPKPGTPLYTVKAYVPIMDSFGLETDIRAHTQGQAFLQSVFDHWSIVPGDPLDKSILLKPLEPSSSAALARDFMVKTRRRKGMSEDVSINKYFDDPMLLELARQDVETEGFQLL